MRRRSFLGIVIGGALSALVAKALPSKAQPQAAPVQLPGKIPYIANNTGTYEGLHRDRYVRVTFPAPADGQSHWRLYAQTEPFGSLGPHYRVK